MGVQWAAICKTDRRRAIHPAPAHEIPRHRDFAHKNDDRTYGSGFALRPLAPTEAPISLLAISLLRICSLSLNGSTNQPTLWCSPAPMRVSSSPSNAGTRTPTSAIASGEVFPPASPPAGKQFCCPHTGGCHRTLPRRGRHRPRQAPSRTRSRASPRLCNQQPADRGLTAIGIAVGDATGAPCAAVCLAMPTARYNRDRLPEQIEALHETALRIEAALERASATVNWQQ